MFVADDGKTIPVEAPFTLNGQQFPANWLRLTSEEEKKAVGISWVVDPEPVDQRFYWDNGLPKDYKQLITQWTAQTRTTAGTLLAPTDWMIIRELDNGTKIPIEWKVWRESVRSAAADKIAALAVTKKTGALAAYVTSSEYAAWPVDPETAERIAANSDPAK